MAKRERSQLDIDIGNAIKMGMSYGRYMGLVKQHPPAKKVQQAKVRKVVDHPKTRNCLCCGKDITFAHGSAKYCNAICRENYKALLRGAKPLVEKVCPTCGKTFMPPDNRHHYCSQYCSRVGQSEKMREYLKRRSGVA